MSVPFLPSRRTWDIRRFGLSPDKLRYRFENRVEPRIFCVSIPKAGTHLLERALCLHPVLYRKLVRTVHAENIHRWGGLDQLLSRLKPGQIIVSHLHASDERLRAVRYSGVKCIFMIRDPRDVVVSQAFYIHREVRHRQHPLYAAQPDVRHRILLSINGNAPTGLLSIGETLQSFAGWLQDDILPVRFEDLVGAEGGQNSDAQAKTIRRIYGFLGMALSESEVAYIAQRLFSNESPTFRHGKAGRWREYFDADTTLRFKQVAGDWLIRYKYETGVDW